MLANEGGQTRAGSEGLRLSRPMREISFFVGEAYMRPGPSPVEHGSHVWVADIYVRPAGGGMATNAGGIASCLCSSFRRMPESMCFAFVFYFLIDPRQ